MALVIESKAITQHIDMTLIISHNKANQIT
jgi:hypothetical protein